MSLYAAMRFSRISVSITSQRDSKRVPTNQLLFFIFLLFSQTALAIESRSNREDIISPRSKKLYRSNSVRQYAAFGGRYASDYNSKQYELTSKYFYQSPDFINEFNFRNNTAYADKGSGSSKEYGVKTSELYDASFSSKARFKDSNNYGVFFHRTIRDNLSEYRSDMHTALGLGRIFFNDRLELDFSAGYHDVKTYGYEVNFISSIRTNFRLSKNVTLIQRGYWFIDHESMDNELKTSLVYRLKDKLSFEIRHLFEKRRYENSENNMTNQVSRSVTLGLIFDLE